jgi:hypothetical protein
MKRVNPLTGLPFSRGFVRDDGSIFAGYHTKRLRQDGSCAENWLRPSAYLRQRVTHALKHARERAACQSLPIDVDVTYLLSIFPDDALCPILKTPMVFGGSLWDSPTLDRHVPTLGYTRGNLTWICGKANIVKQDITDPAVFEAVAKYVRSNTPTLN